MPKQPADYELAPDGSCPRCGQRHVRVAAGVEKRTCAGHSWYDRDSDGGSTKRDTPRPCTQYPAPGFDRCGSHGVTRKQREAAKQRIAEEKSMQAAQQQLAAALRDAYGDDVPDIPPAEAMLSAVSWTYAEVVALRRKVAELDEDERVWGVTREKTGGDDHGTTQEARPNIWWTMLRDSMRDLVKFSAAARAAGCDEARVRLAEQHGQMLADVIRGILGDLQLTAEQQQLVGTVVPRHLRAVAG